VGAVIEIEGVSKRFRLYHEKPHSLKERVIKLGRLPYEEFWALRDIDLEVSQGETVGLLGHNVGGEEHTFTPVHAFAGGFVDVLNGILNLSMRREEVFYFAPQSFIT